MVTKVKRFNNKGFTMVETIITVAIIVILLLVGIVGIVQYLKTMHQLEMDGAAKEIFIAAQNHLSMAESQGYLERTDAGKLDDSTEKWNKNGIYYFVVDGENSTDLSDDDSYLNLMLPYGAIDEEVRTAGSYVVLYQKDTARVIEVYYATETGRYSHVFNEAEYKAMVENFGEDAEDGTTNHKRDRRSYGKKIRDYSISVDNDDAIIGYFGGKEARILAKLASGEELKAPVIEVINQDQLLVRVVDTNTNWRDSEDNRASLKLLLHGETSGVDKEVIIAGPSVSRDSNVDVMENDAQGDNQYTVYLDDITTSNHFYNLFCDEDEPMIPGENITVKAVAYSNTALTNIAYSSTVKTNSIFADLAPTGTMAAPGNPSETAAINTVRVAYTRHLENLATAVSGYAIDQLNVIGVEQVKDISFCEEESPYGEPGFKANIGKAFNITHVTDDGKEKLNCFMPVVYGTGVQYLVYDGKNHKISGIKVDTTGAAGLFANLCEGSKVSNLELVNFDIKSTGGNAGALAGTINDTDIYGVLAHNVAARDEETKLEIYGTANVGGLVGAATGGSTVNLSAAAVYVRGTTGDVGGLIGELSGSTVTNSYSGGHTDKALYGDVTTAGAQGRVNVIGGSGSKVGGLVGSAANNSQIQYAYSTCSVIGGTPSGFAGSVSGSSIKVCYATGQVQSVIADADTQAFVGAITGTILSGNSYLMNVSDNDKTTQREGITGISGNDLGTGPVAAENNRAAARTYDPVLVVTYGGKYYFKTIAMMNGSAVTSATGIAALLAKCHYGDWEPPLSSLYSFEYTFLKKHVVTVTRTGTNADNEYTGTWTAVDDPDIRGDCTSTVDYSGMDEYTIKEENGKYYYEGEYRSRTGITSKCWCELSEPVPDGKGGFTVTYQQNVQGYEVFWNGNQWVTKGSQNFVVLEPEGEDAYKVEDPKTGKKYRLIVEGYNHKNEPYGSVYDIEEKSLTLPSTIWTGDNLYYDKNSNEYYTYAPCTVTVPIDFDDTIKTGERVPFTTSQADYIREETGKTGFELCWYNDNDDHWHVEWTDRDGIHHNVQVAKLDE